MNSKNIRNFCIVAHIDHGKSTLADRLLEKTGTLNRQEMKEQVLDDMTIERERGITIKSHAIKMNYKKDNNDYIFNLIDTPGHVDFTYEVSRSIAACEGALLVVDASQGIEAQTLSNLFLALENDLTIIPVINKIDLPSAQVDKVKEEIIELIGCDEEDILLASAKNNIGIEEILSEIANKIPSPNPERNKNKLRALVFDSVFDPYRGAVMYVRVIDGCLRKNMRIRMLATGQEHIVEELGTLKLKRQPQETLEAGEIGYVLANIKNIMDAKIGDTITDVKNPTDKALKGFKEIKPMVFSGLYPVNSDDYDSLKSALEKLRLNDAAFNYEPETSIALGFGFRAGFLGVLHMEVIQGRLEEEFGVNIITTVPSVKYKIIKTDGSLELIDNPEAMPPANGIETIEEPIIKGEIIVPSEYVGVIMKLGEEKRGTMKTMEYITPERVNLHYEFPLSEIIFDFYDKLKSITRGYASFDYEFKEYRTSDMIKLNILINGDPVDAFSTIIHRSKSFEWGRALASKLKEKIPRQLFEVAIQASIGTKVIARTTVKPLRKNVTAKCYGGDISRKRKLLEKQKEGKKRMKQIGSVEIPQEAFLAVLGMDS